MAIPEIDVFAVDEEERRALARLGLDDRVGNVTVSTGGEELVLPANAERAVRRLLHDLALGSPVHLVPVDAELTTQQAADLLGLSRTYVVRLIDQGDLAAHMVGTHRRLLAADVLQYRRRRGERLDAVAEIAQADSDQGIRY